MQEYQRLLFLFQDEKKHKLASKFHLLFICLLFIFAPVHLFGQVWKEFLEEQAKAKMVKELIGKYEKGQPISTTFDDADFEADFLDDFEPAEKEYSPLDLQPKVENGGGYKLSSGVYTMYAKSFCLKGYSYGPSKGDGHLYAPLKGKKADFVQSIIKHYGAKPEIPQSDVQVLLWAIVAGADMKTLGAKHTSTLNALFSPGELATLHAKGFLDSEIEKSMGDLKKIIVGQVPAKLQELFDADEKIRNLVSSNKAFQEIEKIAIIAGVAPIDMVREVSKGRWSYHHDGYFVRFFPQGYQQTRVDVYVPYLDAIKKNKKGNVVGINNSANQPIEVIYDPSGMIAAPANRPSQRIGVSPVPVNPSKDYYEILFYAFKMNTLVPKSRTDTSRLESFAGHIYLGFAKNGKIEKVKGLSPPNGWPIDGNAKVDKVTDESYLLGFHTHCFALKVTKEQYDRSLAIEKEYYIVGANDCVNYADDVADLLGLVTPKVTDNIWKPEAYINFIHENNRTVEKPSTLCNIKSGQTARIGKK